MIQISFFLIEDMLCLIQCDTMYKMLTGRKSVFYLDFIRALAIVLVLVVHITKPFFKSAPHGTYYMHAVAPLADFGNMGVPLFLMISGALLLNRKYDLGDFLKRRYTRVLIPFLFWSVVTIGIRILFDNQTATLPNIYLMFVKDYWYVWMILGVYLFIPIINSFIREYGMKGIEYFLVVWAFVMFLNTIGQYPFYSLELTNFAGYLGYLVLGYYISNKEFKLSNGSLIALSLTVFLIFTLISIDYTVSMSYLKHKLVYYQYETIIIALQSAGLYMFLRYFAVVSAESPGSIKNKVYSFFKDTFMFKIIFFISTFSYGIYLAHYTPLFFFKWFSKHYIPIFSRNPIAWFPIMLIVILGITLLILWIFDKIPGLRNVNGAH